MAVELSAEAAWCRITASGSRPSRSARVSAMAAAHSVGMVCPIEGSRGGWAHTMRLSCERDLRRGRVSSERPFQGGVHGALHGQGGDRGCLVLSAGPLDPRGSPSAGLHLRVQVQQ